MKELDGDWVKEKDALFEEALRQEIAEVQKLLDKKRKESFLSRLFAPKKAAMTESAKLRAKLYFTSGYVEGLKKGGRVVNEKDEKTESTIE